jgi:hypothetical protein
VRALPRADPADARRLGALVFGGLPRSAGHAGLVARAAALRRSWAERERDAGTFASSWRWRWPCTARTAIFQATPLAVTMGAALFLGEKVGWRRWTAIGVGFWA